MDQKENKEQTKTTPTTTQQVPQPATTQPLTPATTQPVPPTTTQPAEPTYSFLQTVYYYLTYLLPAYPFHLEQPQTLPAPTESSDLQKVSETNAIPSANDTVLITKDCKCDEMNMTEREGKDRLSKDQDEKLTNQMDEMTLRPSSQKPKLEIRVDQRERDESHEEIILNEPPNIQNRFQVRTEHKVMKNHHHHGGSHQFSRKPHQHTHQTEE